MSHSAGQPRKTAAGSAGQFDSVRHKEPAASLGPTPGRLNDDELLRRDREVALRHLADGEKYNEHPVSTLRAVYDEESERLRGWRDSTEPRYTHPEMRPHWERKESELAYLTGATNRLL